jgi:uncharacterized protein YgiM (DUF1202 family)
MQISRLAYRAAAVVGIAGVGLATVAPTAGAAPDSEQYYFTCTVVTNGVHFRTGPGTQYKSLGVVNEGQKLDVFHNEQNPVDGWWEQGDLWGGPKGVWIRGDLCY